jgi:hypothetical protein
MESDKITKEAVASNESVASTTATNKTNSLAVAALVMAFIVAPIGLVLGIAALAQIKKSKESGKGLAVGALVVSSLIILLYVVIFMLFAGLVFSANKYAKDNGVSVDTNKGTIEVKNKEGESVELGNAGVPDGFPSDVPIYPGGKIIASSKTDGSYTVTFNTPDSKSKVEAYYKSNLATNGWTSGEGTSSNDFGSSSTTTLKKGDSFINVMVTESTQGNPTAVSLIIYKKL